MRKRVFVLLLLLSATALGTLVDGPVHAAVDPGPDPNESGVTETADLPEPPEAPEAPEEGPDVEDPGVVGTTDATGPSTPTSPQPSDQARVAKPPAPAGSAPIGEHDLAPVGGAAPVLVAATDDDGTDPLPFVLAGVIGAALGAAGVAAFGRRHLTPNRVSDTPPGDGHDT